MAGFQRANPYLDEIITILQNHLERHGGDADKARQALSKADNEWIDSEFLHCMQDTRYFLSNYYAIKTEDKGYTGLYPFWDSQEILHDEFRNLEKKYGCVKAMVNKARQMGGSTYVSGEIFHKTIFSEHVNTIVVAQDGDQSGFIFDMYRSALDFLPWWMRPRIRYQQAGTFIDFDEKDETLRTIRPGLKTRIYVDNGNKPSGAGRGKCQVPWTQVWTTEGPSTLEELFRSTCDHLDGTVDVDGIGEWFIPKREVFTWAFNGSKLEKRRITKVFRQSYSGPIQQIEVANGVKIEKTPEHRVLSSREWVRKLSAGDHVECIGEIPWEGTESPTAEFAELLAWQIAEGCEGLANTCFITQKDSRMRERIASLVVATSGKVPINKRAEDLAGKNKAGYVLISGKEYKRLVTSQGYEWGLRSRAKKIPAFVFRWNKEAIAIFLRAFFEAESSVSDKIDIISASKQVMESLRMMCAAYGISLRVRPCIKYASNTERKVRRTYYRGYISGPSLLRFHKHVGYLSERKQSLLQSIVENSNGYTLQQCPRVTQMFRDACRESGIPTKKILGMARLAERGSMSHKVASEAVSRMEGLSVKLPKNRLTGRVHYCYKSCNQQVLSKWAIRIREELRSELCEEKITAVSEYDYQGYIYDLEVEETHNYPTAGVITHNTFKFGHLDELAFWDKPSQLTKSLLPTMNARDGFYVMISTPNGRNDAWHNLWRRAEAGKSDWHPIYIPYYRRDKTYSLPIPKGEVFELTADEKAMRDQVEKKEGHRIKDEVFNWARNRREAFIAVDGDDRMFSQEFSSTAEESFQTSATTAYPRGIINRLAKRTLNPLWVGEIAFDKASGLPTPYLRATTPQEYIPEPEHENRLHVWEKPIREFRYVMGVDVSLGNDGGDYSCVQVIKLTDTIEPDEQVACWRGLIVPEDLAEVVYSMGHWYNEALAAVEVNSMGMVTNSNLVRDWEYENVYRYKRMDRLKNFLTDIIGFWTDEKSKRALMSKMSKALHSDSLRIPCEQTVRELYDFTDDYEAASDGAHDDRLMALHIALYCGHEGEVNDRHGSGAKQVGESKANVFEVKDRFGTNIATTTSQPEAERISKKHLGSFTVRNSTASTTVFIAGKKRRVPADFQNTDFSPIHDGDGTAHRMYYEEDWNAEDITPEAIQEFEQAEAEVEASPDAWMFT